MINGKAAETRNGKTMSGDKNGKVSRLFVAASSASKTAASRAQEVKNYPAFLHAALLLVISVAAVFMAFPMPDSLLMSEIADRSVRADRELMVEDPSATQEKRDAARRNSPTVFDLDDGAAHAAKARLNSLFLRGRTILNAPDVQSPVYTDPKQVNEPDANDLQRLRERFNALLSLPSEDRSFNALLKARFSPQLERTIFELIMDLLNQGIVADKKILLDQRDRGILIRRTELQLESLAPYAAVFPSLSEARRLVRERAMIFSSDYEPALTRAVITVAQSLLRPNLVMNREETVKRRNEAAAQVAPVYFQVKPGEIIVREGERVNELARLKLRALASKADRKDWFPKASGHFVLIAVFLGVTYLVAVRIRQDINLSSRDKVFLATTLILSLTIAYAATQVGDAMAKGFPGINKTTIFFATPVAAAGMTVTVFLGPFMGIVFSVVASALTGLIFDRQMVMFIYAFLSSVAGLAGLVNVRDRGAVVKAGLLAALVNMAAILGVGLVEQVELGRAAAFYIGAGLLSGILSGVIVTGLVPLFEMIFRYTTNVKLLELANLDQPILRELMVQAPGTYHHSVIVGAMVEAAAEAIGANPLLAKVSAYYHDLGKMKKPLYFVENQITGVNKHEKLAPSMSALILTSHVKDGVELARQHNLSPQIIDIIQQHHGTSLIAYFFQKARDQRTPDAPEINMEDYRYPGPKPQTREAGLVMLADAVEAASRSIGEPTPARIQGMVQKIINNIFSDGQLDECELTLKNLHLIARSFNKILTGIFHRRISYPEPASKDQTARTKAANGHNGIQPAKEAGTKNGRDKGERQEDLKRLGIS
jgi:putative nucleotidyltransferase with HDIG domain